ncbi:hypothetical protein [Pseudoxanthomonas sp. 10H]|uniref:hypothetical protein n=1 Tax=Pseudoxanthomonas sp. 10H TaxID=3242729 RepID=UPI0035580039
MHESVPTPARPVEPLVAFRAALQPSIDAPALVELPGRHRPPERPAEQGALERRYARLPRRILVATAACAAVALVFCIWMLSGHERRDVSVACVRAAGGFTVRPAPPA